MKLLLSIISVIFMTTVANAGIWQCATNDGEKTFTLQVFTNAIKTSDYFNGEPIFNEVIHYGDTYYSNYQIDMQENELWFFMNSMEYQSYYGMTVDLVDLSFFINDHSYNGEGQCKVLF